VKPRVAGLALSGLVRLLPDLQQGSCNSSCVALMSLWWFGWSGTVFLSSTRVIFAAAFDRLLPEKVAEVDERTGTPVNALLLMVIPSL
jgi:amino acid transporter